MTIIPKYEDGKLTLPCVVDYLDFENHAAIDIIHMKGDNFKKEARFQYLTHILEVVKKLKDYPVQTDSNLQNRMEYRKVRYYCNKIKTP